MRKRLRYFPRENVPSLANSDTKRRIVGGRAWGLGPNGLEPGWRDGEVHNAAAVGIPCRRSADIERRWMPRLTRRTPALARCQPFTAVEAANRGVPAHQFSMYPRYERRMPIACTLTA
jgi:hypothetical protein